MMCSIVSKEMSVQIKTNSNNAISVLFGIRLIFHYCILTRTVYPFDVANLSRMINLTEIG